MATVNLTWSDNSGNELGFKLWKAYSSASDTYTTAANIITAGEAGVGDNDFITGTDSVAPIIGAELYADTVLVHTYAYYVLKAYNASGESAAATIAGGAQDYLRVAVTH